MGIRAVAIAVAFVAACGSRPPTPTPAPIKPATPAAPPSLEYAGSLACRACHAQIYDRWKLTPMANVVREPAPGVILPDLDTPDPLVKFTRADIALVYGSLWKQRYFTRKDGELYPLPAQWDVKHFSWKPYHVPNDADWWTAFYGKDNLERPTGPLCDGCHSVDYDLAAKKPREWNVGCERCHGPGAAHVRAPTKTNIVNPSNLSPVEANDVCISCHSQGRPIEAPTQNHAIDWPVGYRVGLHLKDFWRLEEHAPGDATFTHYADGTGHKNRMQGNDFVQAVMYEHGITCANCHDVHGTNNNAQLVLPISQVCGQCHEPGGQNGPRAKTLEAHTHHKAGSTGSSCVACHMPAIEQTLGDVMVRSHTFRFITPSATEHSKIPNPCTLCHADKSTAWASDALRTWDSESPWRVAP